MELNMEGIRRIIISRMRFIGDIVLTTPLLPALRDRFPQAWIGYLGDRQAISLLENNPYLDKLIGYDFARPSFIEQPRIAFELRRCKPDLFIDLFSNPRSALLARASGAPMRIGKDARGRGSLYTHRIADDGRTKTAIEFHFQYLKPLGITHYHSRTEILLTADEKREARTFLRWQDIDTDRPIVGLHPGATWPAKMWPWEKFAELADLIRAKLNAQVVVTQGPNDAAVTSSISHRAVGNLLVLPVMPLRQLAAILSCLRVYVANDNGTMHIAPAVGTRTIGIFGPGEEEIWFPYATHEGHIALRKNVPCHPCHLDYCNRNGDEFMACMHLLDVKEVFEEVRMRIGD